MNVLGLISAPDAEHLNAAELWRVYWPLRAMAKIGWGVEFAWSGKLTEANWARADVVVSQGVVQSDDEGMAAMVALARRDKKLLVYDLDDDIWRVPSDFSVKAGVRRDLPDHERMIRNCDLVTVTGPHLHPPSHVRPRGMAVLPNAIDPELWERPRPPRPVRGLTVGIHGGSTHQTHWEILGKVWPELARKYPALSFLTVGDFPHSLLFTLEHDRLRRIPYVPLADLPAAQAQIDICTIPMPDNRFNRAKSPIKFLESTLAGSAVVASPTLYGDVIRHGETGFIARTFAEWIDACTRLIELPYVRHSLAANARADVLERWTVDAWAPVRASLYERAWERANGVGPQVFRVEVPAPPWK